MSPKPADLFLRRCFCLQHDLRALRIFQGNQCHFFNWFPDLPLCRNWLPSYSRANDSLTPIPPAFAVTGYPDRRIALSPTRRTVEQLAGFFLFLRFDIDRFLPLPDRSIA